MLQIYYQIQRFNAALIMSFHKSIFQQACNLIFLIEYGYKRRISSKGHFELH